MAHSLDSPTIALIVAAGASTRYGAEVPKPYIKLGDRAVLAHVLAVFANHPRIDGVRVVINRAHHPLYKQAAKDFQLFPPVVGGDSRQESVRLGLESIARARPAKVLIHDAARPLVDAALIDRVLDGLENTPAVLPYVPVTDSVHQQVGDALTPLDRSQLVAAQTPQGFDFLAILAAHQQFSDEDVTDDIALAKLAGLDVKLVEGSARNIKLTTPEQLAYAEVMMENNTDKTGEASRPNEPSARSHPSDSISRSGDITKVAMGLDVHAFENHPEGTPADQQVLTLCGLRIPHPQKLKGHSDADVGLHALVDALLGAMAEGDIGQHFPPSDEKWKGADSRVFLDYTDQMLRKKGGEIRHVDITIIGETPKIAPHRQAMRQQLASLLQLDVRRVSIKATTTEGLGFLGRKEGLAAQAVVTISEPGL